jgi:lipopolysaccharide biosynthesis glycosyltransferase
MSTCIVYTVNAGYLVPALVSALGARRHVVAGAADIVICDVGKQTEAGRLVRAICEAQDIRYLQVDPSVLGELPVAYSRLFMTEFLPESYRDIVYLDADSQVWDDLTPLVTATVAEGRILAARDPMTAMIAARNAFAAQHLAHMREMELPAKAEHDYFNSGMIKASRETWAAIGPQAAARVRATSLSRYVDQDVLNYVALDRLQPISARWNYPGFLLGTEVERRVGPRFVHFMSNPRPWHGPFPPWGARGERPYRELEAHYPALAPFRPRLTPARRLKYMLQQRYKGFTEGTLWDEPGFTACFLQIDADTMF